MKRELMLLALATLLLAGCSHGFKSGNGDLLYKIDVDNAGDKIAEGDFISYDMITKTEEDSVLMNTRDMGYPRFTIVPPVIDKGDMNDAMTLLTEGDSATFKISTKLVFKDHKKPAYIKGDYIVYVVKIEKLIHKQGLSFEDFTARVISYKSGISEARKVAEPGSIKKYIADHNLTGTTTPSGLFYSITKAGTGNKSVTGDTVVLNFVSRYTNDILQATNSKDAAIKYKRYDPTAIYMPVRIIIGQQATVPGLNEGLRYLNKGAKATLVLPSSIAYPEGRTQSLLLLTYTPLVYDVEILDIIHPAAKH